MNRLIPLVFLALAACKEEVATLPAPVSMTAEAVGHYCQMDLLEHPGPKAQVHLDGMPYPLFFSQVRDALAYQRMPEQSHAIVAIFVNDMAVAPSWEDTGADNWIDARTAFYVVGSTRAGGMGAPELVPFADKAEAEQFAAGNGGSVMSLSAIPDTEILAPATPDAGIVAEDDDSDFLRRLKATTPKMGG